ncbi:N4-gp56 family major capsid protein [Lachnospiraceae bacterium MD329]|nr:N4-gp56 family major capsid protein [Lachnospiraceae bacterium MD329]
MAINYASKYAANIDERFTKEAMSTGAVNNDYEFVGVKTVNVYSVPTAQMHDYKRTGAGRYGEPEELENSVQELTMTQDRSFTFTIDRGNYNDTQMSNAAGAALQRQLREVVIPEIDTYRFEKICTNAGTTATGAITKENAYDAFLDGTTALVDNKVPLSGAVAYVSSTFYKLIKLDPSFVKQGDLAQGITLKGQIGTVDGIPIIVLPKSYMPEGVEFFIINKIATTAPVKLSEYKIHDNPPGINGWLVEGRVYHDAFVLENKKKAIYVHKTAAAARAAKA